MEQRISSLSRTCHLGPIYIRIPTDLGLSVQFFVAHLLHFCRDCVAHEILVLWHVETTHVLPKRKQQDTGYAIACRRASVDKPAATEL